MSSKTTLARRLPAVLAVIGLLLAAGAIAQTGSADFTQYTAIGDSLTAGFSSGGLVADAQELSYPALIYAQVNGSSSGFELPLVSNPGIPPLLDLVSLAPLAIVTNSGLGSPTNLLLPRPYDNLAVPGADAADVLGTVTDGGGLHDLILRGLGTQWQQALGLGSTFITVWVGNNDALGAATSGIVIDGVTLTTAADFEANFRGFMVPLAASGAQFAIANIPDVTAIPFVTTVAPVLVDPATSQPVLIGGQLVPLIGPDGPLDPATDFVLLTAQTELAQGIGIPVAAGGTGQPLSDSSVLSGAEAGAINARVAEFNQVIAAVANETGAALVDINGFFSEVVVEGYELGGITYTTEFLTGGIFSYDGVHSSALGYAVVANEFIQAINATYGAEIPEVDLFGFAFGPEGSAGTDVGVASAAGVRFTRAAENQLRDVMGIPRRNRLERMKAELAPVDTPEACRVDLGKRRYCRVCGPCAYGEGHCRSDSECQSGLVCVPRAGADFGLRRNIGICM